MKYVLTGQPPDKRSRWAVGPVPNEKAADAVHADLLALDWTEVWIMPLMSADTATGELDA